MIVGVCGFCWSGSGAVLDYLMEFRNNQVIDKEFDIAYHPDGLCDLDFNLNENCAKFLSSGVSIPRFDKLSKMLLSDITKGRSNAITHSYLNSIIQAQWIGSEEGQSLLHNKWVYNKIGMRIRYKIINKLPMDFCVKYKIYPLDNMYFSVKPNNFLEETRIFTDRIFEAIGLDLKRPIIVNQLFPGNSPTRSMRFFRESKAIVVDRDPRDVYISLKAVFPGNSYSVPLDTINNFVNYFKNMHKTVEDEKLNPNVLFIRFEDFIYKYETISKQINEFLGLTEHTSPKMYFIPEKSVANTRVFEKYPMYKNEIEYIETNLKEYIYDYSSVPFMDNDGDMFDDNPRSFSYRIE